LPVFLFARFFKNSKNEFRKNERKAKNGPEPHMKNVMASIRFYARMKAAA